MRYAVDARYTGETYAELMSGMNYGKRLGELIRNKRRIAGLNQTQLSEDAFGTHSKVRRISDLENGVVRNPHPKTIDPIIVTLGITDAELAACLESGDAHDPDLDRAYREARNLIDALAYQFDHANPEAGLGELDEFLRAKATEWRQLRARLDEMEAGDADITAEKNRAIEALGNGKLDEVDAILAALEDQFQQQRTLVEVNKQAEIRVARADTCIMNEDPNAALEHYLQAARFFKPFSEAEAVRVLDENAHRIYEGSLRSLKPRFTIGTALLEEALKYKIVRDDATRHSAIRYQLSLLYRNASLQALPQDREGLRKNAISHARAAADFAAEASNPYQLVITKISLANCLLKGERNEGGREEVEEAIALLQSAKVIAIEEPDVTPMLSHVCNSLGSVILDHGQKGSEAPTASVVAEALQHFSDAANYAETHCNFETWGAAKANRARMLSIQAERADAEDPQRSFLYVRAISEYLAAIETFPETLFPGRLADTQALLGRVLSSFANALQDERAEAYMVRAIHAFEAASLIYESLAPIRWAECQIQIGSIIAQHGLSRFTDDPNYDYEHALQRIQSGREVFEAHEDIEQIKMCDRVLEWVKSEFAKLPKDRINI